MDLSNYLADSPPTVVKVEVKQHFEALSRRERLYAGYLSRLVPLFRLLHFDLALDVRDRSVLGWYTSAFL